jgi:hypothetical protein
MNVERRGSVKLSEGLVQLNVLQEETKLQTKPFIIDRWQVYEAYRRVKANAGSAGIDKQSLADFEVNLKKIFIRCGTGCHRGVISLVRLKRWQYRRNPAVKGCLVFLWLPAEKIGLRRDRSNA